MKNFRKTLAHLWADVQACLQIFTHANTRSRRGTKSIPNFRSSQYTCELQEKDQGRHSSIIFGRVSKQNHLIFYGPQGSGSVFSHLVQLPAVCSFQPQAPRTCLTSFSFCCLACFQGDTAGLGGICRMVKYLTSFFLF